ncbi:uncharacterized protein LOC130799550 isoform X3 [Amaranthus tricolor]|uniref:uncharacterized protein LOC130799550 isoform X3 n=1 Tax=Amaranthus tricolor TaxID=29722 RepID=UPI0025886F1F|nr:uncharacterized protein LOC130799550 isoform X3 [Amaranthus tricolor]
MVIEQSILLLRFPRILFLLRLLLQEVCSDHRFQIEMLYAAPCSYIKILSSCTCTSGNDTFYKHLESKQLISHHSRDDSTPSHGVILISDNHLPIQPTFLTDF